LGEPKRFHLCYSPAGETISFGANLGGRKEEKVRMFGASYKKQPRKREVEKNFCLLRERESKVVKKVTMSRASLWKFRGEIQGLLPSVSRQTGGRVKYI